MNGRNGEGQWVYIGLVDEGIPTAQNTNGFTSLEFRKIIIALFSIKSITALFSDSH